MMKKCAVELAQKGYCVFPVHWMIESRCSCGKPGCTRIAKHPIIRHWKNKASCDRNLVTGWWEQFPDANIGLATGRKSGVIVLDVDGAEGEESLKELIDLHGPLPTTLTASTGRGRHLYFRTSDQVIANSVAKLGRGLDIRGEGGYVVAPPSIHYTGAKYQWIS